MKRNWKDKLYNFFFSLIPLGEIILLCGILIGYLMLLVVIILSAPKLKYFFLPAFLLYLIPIFAFQYYYRKKQEKNHIRALGGDELYEELYPKEVAKQKKQAKREEKEKSKMGPEL